MSRRITLIACLICLPFTACKSTTTTITGGPRFARTGNEAPVVTTPPDPAPPRTTPTPPKQSEANTDPCATALHDLAAPLLMYYQANGKLPPDLAAVRQNPAFDESMSLACPVSRRPYVYNAAGIPAGGNKGRAVLYDALPTHGGMRWALTIVEPEGQRAIVTKVVALPDALFTSPGAK
ncbi:MAG TPA: hypothetical protein VEA69_21985 [Tepidisphaeraceae bacterium]|nr:hypothetical protein [Tepidisphaeraceae bacterium]